MLPYPIDAFKEEIEQGKSFFLIDIRSPEDFQKGHIASAINFPFANWNPEAIKKELPKDQEIIVICRRGRTAVTASQDLHQLGFTARPLEGGMQAWGSTYRSRPIVSSPDLSIYQIARVARGCLSYLIVSKNEALVVDPGRHISFYLDLLKQIGATLKGIIDTHAHADHLSGGKALAEALQVPYFLHPYDAVHPKDLLPITFPYHYLKDLHVGNAEIKCFPVPGHTLGQTALLLNNQYLFSGDSLFSDSIGRPDLGEKTEAWSTLHHQSLQALWNLPDNLVILPGHGHSPFPIKTLGEIKKENKGFIQSQTSVKDFNSYILKHLPERPDEYPEIKRANLGIITVDEETADRLEHGQNLCALS